jgi:GNAT superfamily N-acetyltransferase
MGRSGSNVDAGINRIVYRKMRPLEDLQDSKHIEKFNRLTYALEPIGGGHEWWGAFDGETLVGLASACLVEGGKTVLLSSCVVKGKWRSKGIQSQLISRRVTWAKSEGHTAVVSYVFIENLQSLRNLVRVGFLPSKEPNATRRLIGEDWGTNRYLWVRKTLD